MSNISIFVQEITACLHSQSFRWDYTIRRQALKCHLSTFFIPHIPQLEAGPHSFATSPDATSLGLERLMLWVMLMCRHNCRAVGLSGNLLHLHTLVRGYPLSYDSTQSIHFLTCKNHCPKWAINAITHTDKKGKRNLLHQTKTYIYSTTIWEWLLI